MISCKWFNQHKKYIEQNSKEPTMITRTIQLFQIVTSYRQKSCFAGAYGCLGNYCLVNVGKMENIALSYESIIVTWMAVKLRFIGSGMFIC